jgi:hypothetical protein
MKISDDGAEPPGKNVGPTRTHSGTIEEIIMRKSNSLYCLLAGVMLVSSAAFAKLPPPTPEEQAAAAAKKTREAGQLEKEKVLLERAQARIAKRYGNVGAQATGKTQAKDMPKTTSELPRGVGPTPTRPQSAEAHSAPAK